MNTPEFEAANQRVSAYFEKVCGLDGGSSDTTATTAG